MVLAINLTNITYRKYYWLIAKGITGYFNGEITNPKFKGLISE
jgi:hypothetical protein